MKKLLPLILALIGTGAGVGAGIMLKPAPAPELANNPCGDVPNTKQAAEEEAEDTGREYVKMNNQFVVPVVQGDRVKSLVVLALSVEVPTGQKEMVFEKEPKLRDQFLQVLFDHANQGGFEGTFTSGNTMEILRSGLLEAVQTTAGVTVTDVLITDIARQDQ